MKVLAPAKLNLFLKVVNKRSDGYHNVKTGVTFLNLYDEIIIKPSPDNKNTIDYVGKFAPNKKKFKNDIIIRLLNFLYKDLGRKFYVKIKIKKNIPYGAGLGSASADAAAVLKGLKKIKLIAKYSNNTKLSLIGSDIPACMKSRDCVITGRGDRINYKIKHSKNFFLLVKPNFSLSTTEMYSNHKFKAPLKNYSNDLLNQAIKKNPSIKKLLKELSILKGCVFANMTGSGSCCYSVFNNNTDALAGLRKIRYLYPKYWLKISYNKTIN